MFVPYRNAFGRLDMKFRMIAGCLLVVGIVAAFIIWSGKKEKEIKAQTSAFVTETVTAISKDWNPDALARRAEPGLIKAMASQGEGIEDLFNVYRKLGNLKDDPDCRLKDTSSFNGAAGSYTTVSYTCNAEYDNGPATLLITLRRVDTRKDWKVYYINVSSPYFSELNYRRTK